MQIFRYAAILGIFGLAAPVYGTVVTGTSGRPCTSAPTCTGGPVWVDGYRDGGSGTGNFNQASESAPFNLMDGFEGEIDEGGENAMFTWVMTYSALPGGATINSVDFIFGVFDSDIAVAGNQVALFTVDGTDLTLALNAQLEIEAAGGDGQGFEYNIHTFALPGSVFSSLMDGSVTFVLNFQGPASTFFVGFPGGCTDVFTCDNFNVTYNAVGLDYAQLEIDYTEAIPGIPEPSTFSMLALAALAGAGLWRRRVRS